VFETLESIGGMTQFLLDKFWALIIFSYNTLEHGTTIHTSGTLVVGGRADNV